MFERNGLKVTAFKVEHDPASPAYGYRFEYKGRVVVVSGDTAKSANLARHAAGADLLIHEVIAKNLLQFAAGNLEKAGNLRRAKMQSKKFRSLLRTLPSCACFFNNLAFGDCTHTSKIKVTPEETTRHCGSWRRTFESFSRLLHDGGRL